MSGRLGGMLAPVVGSDHTRVHRTTQTQDVVTWAGVEVVPLVCKLQKKLILAQIVISGQFFVLILGDAKLPPKLQPIFERNSYFGDSDICN